MKLDDILLDAAADAQGWMEDNPDARTPHERAEIQQLIDKLQEMGEWLQGKGRQ